MLKKQQGAVARAGKLLALGIAGFALLVVGLFAFGGAARSASSAYAPVVTNMDGIKRQVATDAVRQYQIAKRNNDAIQSCVQAGLVVAAYLQAHDEPNYVKWRAVEDTDCRAAGLR